MQKIFPDLHCSEQNSVSGLKKKGNFTHPNLGLNLTREFKILQTSKGVEGNKLIIFRISF